MSLPALPAEQVSDILAVCTKLLQNANMEHPLRAVAASNCSTLDFIGE
jgi:hypothetical protein